MDIQVNQREFKLTSPTSQQCPNCEATGEVLPSALSTPPPEAGPLGQRREGI